MQTFREISFLQQPKHSTHPNLEETWSLLLHGLKDIYGGKTLAQDRYMELYDVVYQYCTSSPLSTTTQRRSSLPNCELLGEQLYTSLQGFLERYLLQLAAGSRDKFEDMLLTFYQKTWNDFTFSSKVVHHIFLYMNRHWVRRVLEDDREVYEVYALTLYMWRAKVLHELQTAVTDAVLKLITKERNGEPINTLFICCVRDSYVDVGVNPRRKRTEDLEYYRKQLELPLIQETRQYYTVESSEFLQQNSVADYVRRALLRLDEENGRVDRYLHKSSRSVLIQTCEDVLIEQHLTTLLDELQVYLNSNKDQEMFILFQLVSRTKGGLRKMQDIVESHIVKQGLDAIAAAISDSVADARVYVSAILQVYNRYKQVVLTVFQNHRFFTEALDKACTQFINKNAATSSSAQSNKSPELLAKYCDFLLKKSSKVSHETELEDLLNDVMVVFKYLESKDVFQKFYGNLLAKRLVDHLSMSEDAEATMISKLKEACGAMCTSKLEKMFQDISVSSGVNDQFSAHLKELQVNLEMDFHVDVLTHGSWPFQSLPSFALPSEIETCLGRFTTFYKGMYADRKLVWLYHKSRAEISTTCFKRRHILTSSLYQVAVLLQYNRNTSFTVQQLHDNTQISFDDLQQVLQTLLKVRLLFCDQSTAPGHGQDSDLPLNAVCHLYQDYRNKKMRVNINVPLRSVENRELESTHKNVEDERFFLIQAAIIRVMKTKKQLGHLELVQEVFRQLSARFRTEHRSVKKCIDYLIDRDYLMRSKHSPDVYQYIA